MNARDAIEQNSMFDVYEAERMLDALRAAAGGADRVVLAWEPTPCATCDGCGGNCGVLACPAKAVECKACGGSGVDGYTVTLHTLELWSRAFPEDGKPAVFRLVAVSPEPPKGQP